MCTAQVSFEVKNKWKHWQVYWDKEQKARLSIVSLCTLYTLIKNYKSYEPGNFPTSLFQETC
jgi:hypothetical protein